MKAILPLLLLALTLNGCFTEGVCLTNDDCEGAKICSPEGTCVYECYADDDCYGDYVCDDHACVLPAGCKGCSFPHAAMSCDAFTCEMGSCTPGYIDLNGKPSDGCEYACETPGALQGDEACDGYDNDCDGKIDEDFDLSADVDHCGDCDTACPTPDHAVARCIQSACTYSCLEGWYDNDGEAGNGCEAAECVVTEDPETTCDGKDNDCDGEVDEGFDTQSDPDHCGPTCAACSFDHGTADCDQGQCVLASCDQGFYDVNEQAHDGCECEDNGDETCNGVDDDCNGLIDDGIVCCPDDMVQIQPSDDCVEGLKPYCIDKYEASIWANEDCTGTQYGGVPTSFGCEVIDNYPDGFPDDVGQGGGTQTKEVYACSLPGVYAARCITLYQASQACENAGKHLCTPEEWQMACQGPECYKYPYGNEFTWDICNYIQTFEDGFHVEPTDAMPGCESDYGVVDISGNVWELDSSGQGHVRGGAFNCNPNGAPSLESCTDVTTFSQLVVDGEPVGTQYNVGFRCCKTW